MRMLTKAWSIGLIVTLGAGTFRCMAQDAPVQLRVTSIPEGAAVTCDGILRDQTPVLLDNLSGGPHLIQAELAGHLPVRRTVTLSPGQKAALELRLEPEKGLVLIHSAPSEAEISIDGANRGRTPLLITDLPLGRYRVRASSAGYLSQEVDLLVENRAPRRVLLSLTSDSANLKVQSTPPGAAVTVNGLSKGVTPCTIERLPSGDNKVVLTLAEYLPYQDTVKLRAGEDHTVEVTLQPLPATLSVVCTPAGAKVFVDERLRGQSPLTLDAIPPGTYTLKVEREGYKSQTRVVEVKRRDTRVEEFTLVRKVGILEVIAEQPGLSVLVDGVERGAFPVGTGKPADPLRIEVGVGEHTVELRKKGYSSLEKRIAIVQGEVVRLREILKRNFVADTVVRLKSGETVSGVAERRFPDGDIEVETRPGIFRTIKGTDVESVDKAPAAGN